LLASGAMAFAVKWPGEAGASFWHADGARGEKSFAFDIDKFSLKTDYGISKILKAAYSGSLPL